MNENILIENMIRWAEGRLGETRYAGWCLSFIEDALELPNGMRSSAVIRPKSLRFSMPTPCSRASRNAARSSFTTASAPVRPVRSTGATAASASEPVEWSTRGTKSG